MADATFNNSTEAYTAAVRMVECFTQRVLSGEIVQPDDRDKSLSELIYVSVGCSKKVLFVLSIGLNDEKGCPLISLEQSPWSRKEIQLVKPSNAVLAMEVRRRQKQRDIGSGDSIKRGHKIKPNNKKRETLWEWLNTYPIS